MTLDKSVQDNDRVFEQDGFKVVISQDYNDFYQNLKIDWVEDFYGRGFRIYDTMKPSCC